MVFTTCVERTAKKSVNKVILVGNVGQDPEVKYTNERFKDRNDQWQDRTEWHSVVGRSAMVVPTAINSERQGVASLSPMDLCDWEGITRRIRRRT